MKKYFPKLRSKNTSCELLKAKYRLIGPFSVRSVIRFGSRTPIETIFGFVPNRYVEVNTIEAINISRNKLLMKEAFKRNRVPQSEWYLYTNNNMFTEQGTDQNIEAEILPYPIVAKRVLGYKGIGMVKLDSHEEMMEFIANTNLPEYYFEKFYNFGKEYRVHCTQDHAFLSWRKLRQADAEAKWYFNNSNCAWINENSSDFDAPENMHEIKSMCIQAVKASGLDIGAVDVRVQLNNKIDPNYIILEVNSAPRMGDTSTQLYQKEISEIITTKINGQ